MAEPVQSVAIHLKMRVKFGPAACAEADKASIPATVKARITFILIGISLRALTRIPMLPGGITRRYNFCVITS
jgi:hypothetical protein